MPNGKIERCENILWLARRFPLHIRSNAMLDIQSFAIIWSHPSNRLTDLEIAKGKLQNSCRYEVVGFGIPSLLLDLIVEIFVSAEEL